MTVEKTEYCQSFKLEFDEHFSKNNKVNKNKKNKIFTTRTTTETKKRMENKNCKHKNSPKIPKRETFFLK